jgi:hypothetical protein
LVDGVPNVPIENVGSTIDNESPILSGTLREKLKATADSLPAASLVNTSLLSVKVAAGCSAGDDSRIGVREISVAALSATETCRVAEFEACAVALTVMPESIVIVQTVSLGSRATAASNLNWAEDVPELVTEDTETVVEPHPHDVGVDRPAMVKSDKRMVISSPI